MSESPSEEAPQGFRWVQVKTAPRWREANPQRQRVERLVREARLKARGAALLELLRQPPVDFDGSNEALSRSLGFSVREIGRTLKYLEDVGSIRRRLTPVSINGSVRVRRYIDFLDKEKP